MTIRLTADPQCAGGEPFEELDRQQDVAADSVIQTAAALQRAAMQGAGHQG